MWAVSALLGISAVILVYQGMINLNGFMLAAGIIIAFIALFALMFTGGKDDTN